MDRVILHADMDCFFAAVEVRDFPHLRGKPVVVGGSHGRGVVSAASYEARKFGVHSAMSMGEALRLCPRLVLQPGRHGRYSDVSRQVFAIFHEFTPDVQGLSIDEAFLDVTESVPLLGDGPTMARNLKDRVKAETGLIVSVGVAPNKFVAKIASDLEKPDSLTVAPFDEDALRDWLAPLKIRRMWGVGKMTEPRMLRLGYETFRDLQQADPGVVSSQLGDVGLHWQQLALGRDHRMVRSSREREKSISHETTFFQEVGDRDELRSVLSRLADKVAQRTRAAGLSGRTVQVKIRFPDFKTITRRRTLPTPTDQVEPIFTTAWHLVESNVPPRQPLRLIGVSLTGFNVTQAPPPKRSLFADAPASPVSRPTAPPTALPQQHRDIDRLMDAVRQQIGQDALVRGRDLFTAHRHNYESDKPPEMPED